MAERAPLPANTRAALGRPRCSPAGVAVCKPGWLRLGAERRCRLHNGGADSSVSADDQSEEMCEVQGAARDLSWARGPRGGPGAPCQQSAGPRPFCAGDTPEPLPPASLSHSGCELFVEGTVARVVHGPRGRLNVTNFGQNFKKGCRWSSLQSEISFTVSMFHAHALRFDGFVFTLRKFCTKFDFKEFISGVAQRYRSGEGTRGR